jgi:predicted alpha/beta-fold hydrolase
MNFKVIQKTIEYFYPLIIIILLLLFKYISFSNFIFGYLVYCIIVYISSKSSLFYIKTDFNIDLLNNCPSIKNPNFKQYFFLPFTFMQFILLKLSKQSPNKNNKKIIFKEENVDEEGTSIIWASYENTQNTHSNKVLFILPGITGKCSDSYMKNIIAEGLNNNLEVVIFQMRTLSDKMKMPENNTYVNFYEDINKSLKIVKEINNNNLYAIGYSYGANLLTGYLGTKNLETNYIDAGISISNPFDMYMAQRLGEETLYEPLIYSFEERNYSPAVISINKNKNYIDLNLLESSYYVKDFDTEFFGKILGYKNGDDYYRGISSDKYVKNINKPLLVINAKDDPICSYKGIPIDDFCENKNIIFISTDKGAHSCFIENEKDFSLSVKQWIFKPTFEFINYLKNNKFKA